MNIYTKLFTTAFISGLLTACGGGGGGGGANSTPDNVPGKIIPPGLTDDFVPFENTSVLEKINAFLTGNNDQSINQKYNLALSQMIGEAFADYPLARTGKVVDLYNLGVNNAKFNLNALCSTITKVGNTSTMVLKEGQENCIRGGNTFRAGSKIEVTEEGSSTTVTFTNVRYGSNIDFNLKDEYIVSGTLKRSEVKLTSYSLIDYEIANKLEFQRITPSDSGPAKSLEYIKLTDYKYSEEVTDSLKKLKTKGKIVGQPYNQDFSYDFDFETTTPFEVSKLTIIPSLIELSYHLPDNGEIMIYDIFRRYSFGIKQTQPRSVNATVTYQGKEIKPILWSEIISKK